METIIHQRLSTGAYANAEDVLRRAVEAQGAEDDWTAEERQALDLKLKRSLQQVASGNTDGPDARRQRPDTSPISDDSPLDTFEFSLEAIQT